VHRNARLTHWGRQELARRIDAGTLIATTAERTTCPYARPLDAQSAIRSEAT
jgi:hypothetical protein